MNTRVLVFYAGMLYADCADLRTYNSLELSQQPEIYNGGYLYRPLLYMDNSGPWYTCDLCPYPEQDVPPQVRMLALLLS